MMSRSRGLAAILATGFLATGVSAALDLGFSWRTATFASVWMLYGFVCARVE